MTRKKYTSKFKFKVELEAMKERQTLADLAQKYKVTPQEISQWKRAFLDEGEAVFKKGKSSKKSEAEEEKDKLHRAGSSLTTLTLLFCGAFSESLGDCCPKTMLTEPIRNVKSIPILLFIISSLKPFEFYAFSCGLFFYSL